MESSIINRFSSRLSENVKENVVTIIRLLCMFLFLYTAYAKIVDHHRFSAGLAHVHFVGGLAVYVSWLVPIGEILTFFLLLFPKSIKWGFYSFIILMISFTGYIITALLFEERLPCRCGGVIEKLSWTQHLWFNLAFIVMAAFALLIDKLNSNQ
jgi:hypothetical protein